MELTCSFAPTIATPEHIRLAEELGFDRAFVFDSPALYADPVATLALAVGRTSRIKVGIGVMTAHARHLVSNAAMIAHLATLAPGRFELGIGTGFTSAVLLGTRPSRWSEVERYVAALRELLAGRETEWNGHVVGLLQGAATGVQLPVDIPLWVAAEGPKGWATAARLGAGLITNPSHGHNAESDRVSIPDFPGPVLASDAGTVLDDGESLASRRVLGAAGPSAALSFHFGNQGPLANTPELAGHQAVMAEVEESRRHLELHRGHLIEPNEVDVKFLNAEVIECASTAMTREGWAEYLSDLTAAGASGVVYQPAGPDIPRELTAFREAAALVGA